MLRKALQVLAMHYVFTPYPPNRQASTDVVFEQPPKSQPSKIWAYSLHQVTHEGGALWRMHNRATLPTSPILHPPPRVHYLLHDAPTSNS